MFVCISSSYVLQEFDLQISTTHFWCFRFLIGSAQFLFYKRLAEFPKKQWQLPFRHAGAFKPVILFVALANICKASASLFFTVLRLICGVAVSEI
jgi:hypothetical protein